jgi:hypothetical protein
MCTFFVYLCIWLLHLNVCLRQNIDADIGKVIAKVSSQANPTTSAKGPRKDKKKDKQSAQDTATEPKDDVSQNPSVEVLIVDPMKDKKKKRNQRRPTLQLLRLLRRFQLSKNNLVAHRMSMMMSLKVPTKALLKLFFKIKPLSTTMRARTLVFNLLLSW